MTSPTEGAAIREVVERLRARLGLPAFEVLEHWDADLCVVGIRLRGGAARRAYVSVCDTPAGRYDLALEEEPPMDTEPRAGADAGSHRALEFEALAGIVARYFGLQLSPADGPS